MDAKVADAEQIDRIKRPPPHVRLSGPRGPRAVTIGHNRGPALDDPDEDTTQPERIGWRVNEWSALTGTSRETTYRRIRDGTLIAVKYGGLTLVKGFADKTAAE